MDSHQKPYKKLYRSRTDRRIAGVCGGLGDYFGMDPLWIRVLFVVFFFAGGSAFLIYMLLWLLVPESQ